MQEDVQSIIKELKLHEQHGDEGPIYMMATPSFLFPKLLNKVCVFPDKLQALRESHALIKKNEVFDAKSMDTVKWMAAKSTVSCGAF